MDYNTLKGMFLASTYIGILLGLGLSACERKQAAILRQVEKATPAAVGPGDSSGASPRVESVLAVK